MVFLLLPRDPGYERRFALERREDFSIAAGRERSGRPLHAASPLTAWDSPAQFPKRAVTDVRRGTATKSPARRIQHAGQPQNAMFGMNGIPGHLGLKSRL